MSPLRLDEFVLESFRIRTNLADPWPSGASGGVPVVDVDFHALGARSGRRFLVPLSIRVNRRRQDFTRFGYAVDVSIFGYFSIEGDIDDDTAHQMINLNAPSILYGIARGIVAQGLSLTRAGKIILPSINFVELLRQRVEQRQRRSASKPEGGE
jgi:preprotein translocase subunit SecB